MTTRTFKPSELTDDLIDEAHEVSSEPWRHGRKVMLVFPFDDAHWRIQVNEHHDEGWDLTHDLVATKVHQVERMTKVWEPTP